MSPTAAGPESAVSADVGAPAQDEKLSWPRIAGYCAGVIPNSIVNSTIQMLALPIYAVALGVPAVWIGYAISLPRLLDTLADPWIGGFSDNLRGRWGRRRPLMVVGAIVCGAAYAVLWMPNREWSPAALTTYFTAVSLVLYLGYSFYIVPYYTLGNELSFDRKVRTRIMAARNFFIGLPGFILPWTLSLCFLPWWGGNEIVGVRAVGALWGTTIVFLGLLAVWSSREPPAAQKSETTPFFQALRATASNRAFMYLAFGKALALVTVNVVLSLAFYVGYYQVFVGNKPATAKYLGGLGMAWAMTTLFSSPILGYLVNRIGGGPVILSGCVALFLGGLSTWFTFNPATPYAAIGSYMAMSLGLATVLVVAYTYLADVCDADELASGRRREGIYSSVFAFIEKAGAAVAVGIGGQLVSWAGVPRDSSLAVPPETVHTLRFVFAAAPCIIAVMAILCFWRYLSIRPAPVRAGTKASGSAADR